MTEKKDKHVKPAEDGRQLVNRAFRRMAFLLANLVCGIWLLLFLANVAFDDNRPDPGSIFLVLVVSGPLAYFIPYGLVRLIGLAVITLKKPSGS